MLRFPVDLLWPIDPLPLGAQAYAFGSANYWRAISRATLEVRR
jgi:hypothetical protein